jgi:hypothetical protein
MIETISHQGQSFIRPREGAIFGACFLSIVADSSAEMVILQLVGVFDALCS